MIQPSNTDLFDPKAHNSEVQTKLSKKRQFKATLVDFFCPLGTSGLNTSKKLLYKCENFRGEHVIVSATLISAIGLYVYIGSCRYKRADINGQNIFSFLYLYRQIQYN